MSKATVETFKSPKGDRDVFCIRRSDTDTFPFTFGLAKAKLIVSHLEEIKRFVSERTK